MGIYTDYGRFQKAREFKEYCNSGAGIWFAFSMGSPRWDKVIHREIQNQENEENNIDILNVPPSSPTAYSPLYRWFASYKGGENIDETAPLQVQEMSLLDRSFCSDYEPNPSIVDYTKGTWPSNNTLQTNKDTLPPKGAEEGTEGGFSPTVLTLNKNRIVTDSDEDSNIPLISGSETDSGSPTEQHTWNSDSSKVEKDFYPTPSLPAFPVSYQEDWDAIIQQAQEDLVGENQDLYLFYQSSATGPYDTWNEPVDSTKFKSWSYIYHLSQTKEAELQGNNEESTHSNKNPNARPIGLYSFIRGVAKFVEPVSEEMAQNSSISAFKYGSHFWRIVPDANINSENLPHHILLTVSVFPNELSDSSMVERELPVRQVSVFKFPDCVLDQIPELKNENPSRRYQVLKRNRFVIVRGDESADVNINNTGESWEDGRQVYLPFYVTDQVYNNDSDYYDSDYDVKYKNQYLYPNPPDSNTDSDVKHRIRGTIEMLINDFMTARIKDVQQTDRYGYIIGF